jgi:hypothetical protein
VKSYKKTVAFSISGENVSAENLPDDVEY